MLRSPRVVSSRSVRMRNVAGRCRASAPPRRLSEESGKLPAGRLAVRENEGPETVGNGQLVIALWPAAPLVFWRLDAVACEGGLRRERDWSRKDRPTCGVGWLRSTICSLSLSHAALSNPLPFLLQAGQHFFRTVHYYYYNRRCEDLSLM
jgi:hypothetical protein